jgi:lysophospholipase L1-like esterase
VDSLQIGFTEGATFQIEPLAEEKPIVAYGTSICQGACASRPGMTWSNILERSLKQPVINLGFSGNGRLEPELIDLLNEIDAAVYILDCLPNLRSDRDSVTTLALEAIKKLRMAHPQTPIILTDHPGYANMNADLSKKEEVIRLNAALAKAYRQAQQANIPEVYHLTFEALGLHPDSFVDHIHPNDYGMLQYAEAYAKLIREILKP